MKIIHPVIATALMAAAIAAPAHAQSKPPPVPTVPPDLTLSCTLGVTNTVSVQIWTSAQVLSWNVTGNPRLIFSAQMAPTQISFSGDDGGHENAKGSIDRLTGHYSYSAGGSSYFTGTCVPAKPKF